MTGTQYPARAAPVPRLPTSRVHRRRAWPGRQASRVPTVRPRHGRAEDQSTAQAQSAPQVHGCRPALPPRGKPRPSPSRSCDQEQTTTDRTAEEPPRRYARLPGYTTRPAPPRARQQLLSAAGTARTSQAGDHRQRMRPPRARRPRPSARRRVPASCARRIGVSPSSGRTGPRRKPDSGRSLGTSLPGSQEDAHQAMHTRMSTRGSARLLLKAETAGHVGPMDRTHGFIVHRGATSPLVPGRPPLPTHLWARSLPC